MGGHHQRRAMKDGLDSVAIRRLAGNLKRAHTDFDVGGFVTLALTGLEGLELKARVAHVAAAMKPYLQSDPKEAIAGILHAVPEWDRGPADDSLRGFATWPVFVFVETVGLALGEFGLRALGQLTHLFSAEFAIRSFVKKNTESSMAVVNEWASHPDEQVRRLASEGIRPRLPWAGKLTQFVQDPTPVIEVLDKLIDDESLYVRRSVANNLSDIAADHPDLAVATCERWLKTPTAERRWIAKRATRNLIKSGHAGVWGLHGFTETPLVDVLGLRVTPASVAMDEKFSIDFELRSKASVTQRLVVDFVVHHVKAGGKSSAKVFKLCELALGVGERVQLQKAHAFRTITTRRYYPGAHRIEIQVNGKRYAEAHIELDM